MSAKKIVLLLVLASVFCGLVLSAGLIIGKNNAEAATKSATVAATDNKVTLDGPWHQVKSGIPNVTMNADVFGDTILIRMTYAGQSGVYWTGSFNQGDDGVQNFTTSSNADPDKMLGSLFASRDNTKVFTYNNGDLSYQFTMLGKTTTVHLARGE